MTRHRMRLITLATSLICVCFVISAAQGSKQSSVPRIGEIKDYPATGLMNGCGNLYFYKVGSKMTDPDYVFLSRAEGHNAWMNLAGRDVRLRQIKSPKSTSQKVERYDYVYGRVRISVVFESFKPHADGTEPEHMYKMTITVRQGSAVKIIHAVGDSDC